MQFDLNKMWYESLERAKLVVTNVISTTWSESMYWNIPTIIICSDEFFIPDENAVEIMNELRNVKVLLDDPKEAADIVNEYGNCIHEWWNQRERQRVISKFKKMYVSRGRFPRVKWYRELLKMGI